MGFETIATVLTGINTVKTLFGGKSASKDAPQASTAPAAAVTDSAAADRQRQSALIATQGGVRGEELNPDQVGQRQTIFGN